MKPVKCSDDLKVGDRVAVRIKASKIGDVIEVRADGVVLKIDGKSKEVPYVVIEKSDWRRTERPTMHVFEPYDLWRAKKPPGVTVYARLNASGEDLQIDMDSAAADEAAAMEIVRKAVAWWRLKPTKEAS